MILRRLGNKQKFAMHIQQYFPKHKLYIEPFFGAGGMFFNKPKSQYNIVNDLDSDVFNLFQVVSHHKQELQEALEIMPVHEDLLRHYKTHHENEPIAKALRFLFLSNYTYLGKQCTMRASPDNSKSILLSRLDETQKLLFDVQFFNQDYLKFLGILSLKTEKRNLISQTFIYADPPYLETINTYNTGKKWTAQDATDLVEALQKTKSKWAMSEFNHPHILQLANTNNLHINYITERRNIKNSRTEILITNYKNDNTLF